jgi:phosphoglycerate-specific signal transduction histidine kinase
MGNLLTTAQEVLFDLHDLRNNNDDQFISGFSEFETLHEYLDDQITKMTQIERALAEMAGAE